MMLIQLCLFPGIKACIGANCPVIEEPYEVSLDNHGCFGGPKAGRLKASSNVSIHFSPIGIKIDVSIYISAVIRNAFTMLLVNMLYDKKGPLCMKVGLK